jgi:nickel-dependent lactate racemase
LQPGVCGARTTAATHGRLADYPVPSFLGDENSPIRLEIERVARNAGLRFIVNTVLDADGRIAGVFAGDPVAAHRAGVALARDIWTASIPDLADVVVASSYPADIDFWQAQKTLHFMECAVKRGGDLILLTPCPEGVSGEPHHRDMILRYARLPAKRIRAAAKAAGEWDLAGVNTAVRVATTRELADITIVSDGLKPQECAALGANHSTDLGEALRKSMEKHGPLAKVLVLAHGPKVVPVCRS